MDGGVVAWEGLSLGVTSAGKRRMHKKWAFEGVGWVEEKCLARGGLQKIRQGASAHEGSLPYIFVELNWKGGWVLKEGNYPSISGGN